MPVPADALPATPSAESTVDGWDSNAFRIWLTEQSFERITPFCKGLGLIILPIALLMDPYTYSIGLWSRQVQYYQVFLWHLCGIGFVLFFILVATRARTLAAKRLALGAFLVTAAALYTWLGYINVTLLQDLSLFAVGTMFVATVFPLPSHFRLVIYCVSSLLMAAIILSSAPHETAAALLVDLLGVLAFSVMLDRHTMHQSRLLFREQVRVEKAKMRADEVLYNVLPESIADELKNDKVVKAKKFEHMTVLFADIVGFTRFATGVPPDAVVLVLNQIFSMFDELVELGQLEKIKTIGDAYMVVGNNAPGAVADLALAMIDGLAVYNRQNGAQFELRIGIHMGPAVAGVIGIKRFVYDVWGDTVNTASRMESSGTPGRIQVSAELRERLAATHAFEHRGEIDIRGKGVLDTWYLLGRLPPTTAAV